MVQKQIPTPVKVVSVLYYIGAVYYALKVFGFEGGITLAAGVDIISSVWKRIPFHELNFISNDTGLTGTIIYILIFGVAILEFFVAKDLWKGRNWARIMMIIFSVIGILIGVFSFIKYPFDAVFTLLTNGLIAGYLIFSRKTREAFQ
jgi:uncharacterized protein YacL